MTNKITMKEVVEYYFDKHIPLPRMYSKVSDRNYLKRTIESYEPDTGNFMLSGCKEVFNIYSPRQEIEIESRDRGWADIVCHHFFGLDFEKVQGLVYYGNESTETELLGGKWMKYTASRPTKIYTVIQGVKVEGVRTYSTVTNIKVDDSYVCGRTYSVTSTKWAYEANLCHKHYCFQCDTELD